MGDTTQIGWCDRTFNPFIGCTKVSVGCQNCYALDLMDTRYKKVQWGPQGTRVRTSEAYWKKPLQWNKQKWMECADCLWRGDLKKINISESGKFSCPQCSSEKMTVTRQRVFCASLADVFEGRPELTPWRNDLFDMIEQTPNLDWLLLTKRPENVNRMVADYAGDCEWLSWSGTKPRCNIWIGTSVENQKTADERIPELLNIPAKIRFLSCEPLLGPVDLWCARYRHPDGGFIGAVSLWPGGVNWVIVGGESGAHARPMQVEWARSIRDECQAAKVPFFMKQLGGVSDKRHNLEDLPEDLRIREFPV